MKIIKYNYGTKQLKGVTNGGQYHNEEEGTLIGFGDNLPSADCISFAELMCEVVKGEQIYNNMEDMDDPKNGDVMTLEEKRVKHYNYINACAGGVYGLADLKDYATMEYDVHTDMLILDQFVYGGINIRLTPKDQRNYSELLRMATDGVIGSYPIVTRDGVSLADVSEVAAFANGISGYIMGLLTTGYATKAIINAMTTEAEVLAYVDVR